MRPRINPRPCCSTSQELNHYTTTAPYNLHVDTEGEADIEANTDARRIATGSSGVSIIADVAESIAETQPISINRIEIWDRLIGKIQ